MSSFFTSFFNWILVKFIDPGFARKQREQQNKNDRKYTILDGDTAAEEQLAQLEIQNFAAFSNYIMMFLWSMIIFLLLPVLLLCCCKKNDPKELFSKYIIGLAVLYGPTNID